MSGYVWSVCQSWVLYICTCVCLCVYDKAESGWGKERAALYMFFLYECVRE